MKIHGNKTSVKVSRVVTNLIPQQLVASLQKLKTHYYSPPLGLVNFATF